MPDRIFYQGKETPVVVSTIREMIRRIDRWVPPGVSFK